MILYKYLLTKGQGLFLGLFYLLYMKLLDYDPLTLKNILNLITEEDIFCFYYKSVMNADLTINDNCLSPYRVEANPSFRVFETLKGNYRYRARDFKYSYDHDYGYANCIQFVKNIYKTTYNEALKIINRDFALNLGNTNQRLGSNKITTKEVKNTYKIKIANPISSIKIKSRPFTKRGLAYWDKWKISKETLKLFNVSEVQYLILDNYVKHCREGEVFAYRINKNYKILSPYETPRKKWINNLSQKDYEGLYQLRPKEQNSLIITKATKEVMFYREHLDFDSITARSENTLIDEETMALLKKFYSKILVILDNDEVGITYSKKYKEVYGLNYAFFKHKNITDGFEKIGYNVLNEFWNIWNRN